MASCAIVRIKRQRLFEKGYRLATLRLRVFADQRKSLKIEIVGVSSWRRLLARTQHFGLHQFRFEQTRDALRDPVLDDKDVINRRGRTSRSPKMRSALRIDELRPQAYPAAFARDPACERIARAARGAAAVICNHTQPPNSRQRA